MTGRGDERAPERVAEAAQAEGLTLAGCPTPCDPGCGAACHEAHQPPSKRWHESGWSCAEVQLVIARAVAAGHERLAAEIDPGQLEKLADWFDTDDEFKTTMFPETWPARSNEVQQDLRRWARLLRGEEGEG